MVVDMSYEFLVCAYVTIRYFNYFTFCNIRLTIVYRLLVVCFRDSFE